MRENVPRTVPDYTVACIVMFGVNLAWILFAIWSIWGLICAMLFSWALNQGLKWLNYVRNIRRAAAIRRGK